MKNPVNPINKAKDAYHIYKNRKSLLNMFKAVRQGKFKMTLFTYIVMILGLVYTFVPTDLLPDFIPVIGWVDDGILLFLVLQQLRKELGKYNTQLDNEQKWVMTK